MARTIKRQTADNVTLTRGLAAEWWVDQEAGTWQGHASNSRKSLSDQTWHCQYTYIQLIQRPMTASAVESNIAVTSSTFCRAESTMTEQPHFYIQSEICHCHRLQWLWFPVKRKNFGNSSIKKGYSPYFSLHMCETAIFLHVVCNLTSLSHPLTPISYRTWEFWQSVHK